jgi:hypothetical protein
VLHEAGEEPGHGEGTGDGRGAENRVEAAQLAQLGVAAQLPLRQRPANSIFNRTCQSDLGELAVRHGGGGHRRAASTPLPVEQADLKIEEIIAELRAKG